MPALLTGTAGHDRLDVSTASTAYEIRGLVGYDVIYGSAFGDLIVGGPGADQMFGNAGDDIDDEAKRLEEDIPARDESEPGAALRVDNLANRQRTGAAKRSCRSKSEISCHCGRPG